MIIPAGEPDPTPKSPLNPKDSQGSSSSQAPPPPYMSNSHQQGYPYYRPVAPTQPPAPFIPRESATRRFWTAFGIAFLIWFLLGSVTQSIVDVASGSHRHGRMHQYDLPMDGLLPDDMHINRCISGNDWTISHAFGGGPKELQQPYSEIPDIPEIPPIPEFPRSPDDFPYHAHTSFKLPIDSHELFLISRGDLSNGHIDIIQSSEAGDEATVDIEIRYYITESLDRATVCSIKGRTEGDNGVGILTPRRWRWPRREDQVRFYVTLTLPASTGKSPLSISELWTDAPLFSHTVADLQDTVDFKSLKLLSSNAFIDIKNVYADYARIKTSNSHISGNINVINGAITTSNGPITGSFNTTKSLELITSNSAIRAEVGLLNFNPSQGEFVELQARTSNGPLELAASLVSNSAGAGFRINTRTSNAPLVVHFPTSPVDSLLQYEGSTSNSRAGLSLHPTFEGTFSAQTSLHKPTIEVRDDVEDPSGKGRERKLYTKRQTKNSVEGSVTWGPESDTKVYGYAKVKTSNSGVALKF